eukprot:gene2344-4557_t
MEVDDVPLCPSCNHRHVQGVKCHICGHVGRSQIYQKMRSKANCLRSFKLEIFDATAVDSNVYSLWEINTELRKLIYTIELAIPLDKEIDQMENESRHVLGILGDAPVSLARWRFLIMNGNTLVALIDRLAVLPCYRRRGLARQTLDGVISDIRSIAHTRGLDLKGICITCLDEEWIISKLISLGLIRHDMTSEMRGDRAFITMFWDGDHTSIFENTHPLTSRRNRRAEKLLKDFHQIKTSLRYQAVNSQGKLEVHNFWQSSTSHVTSSLVENAFY